MNLVNFYYTLLKACDLTEDMRDKANKLVESRKDLSKVPELRQLTASALLTCRADNPVYAKVGEALEAGVSVYSLTEILGLEYCNDFPEVLTDIDTKTYLSVVDTLIRDVSLHNDATGVLWRMATGRTDGIPSDVDVCFMELKSSLCHKFRHTMDKFLPDVLFNIITTPIEANHLVSELFNDDKYEVVRRAFEDRRTLQKENLSLVNWAIRSAVPIELVRNKLLTPQRLRKYTAKQFKYYAHTAEKRFWLDVILSSDNLDYINAVRNVANSEYTYTIKDTLANCEVSPKLLECDYAVLVGVTGTENTDDTLLDVAVTKSINAVKIIEEIATVILLHYNETDRLHACMSVSEMCAVCRHVLRRNTDDLGISPLFIGDTWRNFVRLHYALCKLSLMEAFRLGEFDNALNGSTRQRIVQSVAGNSFDIEDYLLNPVIEDQSELVVYYNSLVKEHKEKFHKLLDYIYATCVAGNGNLSDYGYTMDGVKQLIGD